MHIAAVVRVQVEVKVDVAHNLLVRRSSIITFILYIAITSKMYERYIHNQDVYI